MRKKSEEEILGLRELKGEGGERGMKKIKEVIRILGLIDFEFDHIRTMKKKRGLEERRRA